MELAHNRKRFLKFEYFNSKDFVCIPIHYDAQLDGFSTTNAPQVKRCTLFK